MLMTQKTPFVFKPFISTDPDFKACGFKEYKITAVEKGTGTVVPVTNPHEGEACSSINSCLTRSIDTSSERTVTFTIKATSFT